MIYKALELIRCNLQEYIQKLTNSTDEIVELKNIAFMEVPKEDDEFPKKIIISLVNIEEEFALKNNSLFRKKNLNGTIDYQNSPVFINMYMLVSSNLAKYGESLKCLSLVIQYFQSKNSFTISNSYDPNWETDAMKGLEFSEEEAVEFKLNVELFSLTFEQINHLWGSLGGKQVPFVLYKVRLVKIEDDIKQKGGGIIKKVELNTL